MAGKGVLVVDDSGLARESTAKLLRGQVDPVLTAKSASEALALIDRPEIAVVISDYQMPGMNGIEFLAQVRERRPEVLRILLTGVADLTIALEAINSGHVTKFFTKSIPREELQEALLQLCLYSDVIAGTAATHKTILIADPSRIVASMIEQVLWDKYSIVSVSDGLAALKVIEREPIDLLVTASQLRYLAGPELVAHLKEQVKVTFPIILLTAGDKVELSGGTGPDFVVRKSADLGNLFKAINGILQG